MWASFYFCVRGGLWGEVVLESIGSERLEMLTQQNLINLYLRDCALHERKLDLRWKARTPGRARARRAG